MKHAFFFLCLFWISSAIAPHAGIAGTSDKARYAQAMALGAADPAGMAAAMTALAETGYARAVDRLAYFHAKGIGVPRDTAAAVALYRHAVALGRTASLVSLGKLHLQSGAPDAARAAFDQAVADGYGPGLATLLWAQGRGLLGTLAEQAKGRAMLRELAAQDDRTAQIYWLDILGRTPSIPMRIDAMLARLHSRVADGDAKSAEALLRFYRTRGHARGTLEVRAALMATPGIRAKVRAEEGLYLARERAPQHFWTLSEAVVKKAPPEVFARALVVTAKIDKNAYVRLLRAELAALGYAAGVSGPYMTAPLVRANAAFCREAGIAEACVQGPLKASTIKAVAAALAQRRAAVPETQTATASPRQARGNARSGA